MKSDLYEKSTTISMWAYNKGSCRKNGQALGIHEKTRIFYFSYLLCAYLWAPQMFFPLYLYYMFSLYCFSFLIVVFDCLSCFFLFFVVSFFVLFFAFCWFIFSCLCVLFMLCAFWLFFVRCLIFVCFLCFLFFLFGFCLLFVCFFLPVRGNHIWRRRRKAETVKCKRSKQSD